ncbi:MAG: hypothetical protein ACOCQX_04350 [Candidatus Nanoarchaeia archaeon]
MNKKGYAEPIVDTFMFFAIILLFVVFGIVFSFMEEQHKFNVEENSQTIDVDAALLQILKTPVEVKGYKTDYAGYIALAYNDGKLQEQMERDLVNLLSRFTKETKYDTYKFSLPDYKVPTDTATDQRTDMYVGEGDLQRPNRENPQGPAKASLVIPTHSGEKITVFLSLK